MGENVWRGRAILANTRDQNARGKKPAGAMIINLAIWLPQSQVVKFELVSVVFDGVFETFDLPHKIFKRQRMNII